MSHDNAAIFGNLGSGDAGVSAERALCRAFVIE